MATVRYLEFVNLDTREVGERVDVTGESAHNREKTMRGMLRNIGERWFVRDTGDIEEALDAKT